MAFSLGTLFVDLKANTAQFLDGMTKASVSAEKTGKDIEKGLGKVGALLAPLGEVGEKLASILEGVGSHAEDAFGSIGKIGGSLGLLTAGVGGATALGGAMLALADHASEVGSKIFEASEKTGIGAEKMSAIMAIAKETGGDFDSLSAALAKAGVNLEKGIIAPGGEVGKILSQVMGSTKALTDLGLKPMGDRIQVVLARIFAMHDAGERNLALNTLLGKGWQENVSALKLLAQDGYGPAIEQAKKFGIFFNDDAARQAREFQLSLNQVKGEVSGLGLSIGKELLPGIQGWLVGLQGLLPNLEAMGLKILAIGAAMTGDFQGATKLWQESKDRINAADQAQTNFLTHLQDLTAGEQKADQATAHLTGTVGKHHDALVGIIQREQDELYALNSKSSKVRELTSEYQAVTREIEKAAAAGASNAEVIQAESLALDVFTKKLLALPAVTPKLPSWGTIAHAGDGAAPNLALPSGGVPGGSLPLNIPALQTIDDLAKLRSSVDDTRGYMRALRTEEDLSGASLEKLAQRFSGLTTYQIAATAEGQRMIEMLSKMDKQGSTLTEHFAELQDKLILEGRDLGGNLVNVLGGSIEQIEGAFAHLAATGKANFRSLYQSITEQVTKAGLQKGVSLLLGGLHLGGQHTKRDGNTANAALYVTPVSESGKTLGGLSGALGGIGKPALPSQGAGQASGEAGGFGGGLSKELSSLFGGVTGSLAKAPDAFASIGKILTGFIGRIFGGFLADGGDVTPGKAYIVGERHPEFFMPGKSGQVVPTLQANPMRPLVYSPTYHINTPNPDAFRRSQSQIVTDGYRHMQAAHARNS